MTRVLSIDTALEACAVSVSDGKTTYTIYEKMGREQTERLLPMIVDACAQADTPLKDIEAVAVTRGPGSFTGVRVGLSVARTLSNVQNIPLHSFTTFEAVALLSKHSNYGIALESKREDIYFQEVRSDTFEPAYVSSIAKLRQEHPNLHLIGNIEGVDPVPLEILTEVMINNIGHGSNDGTPVYLRNADISKSKKTYRTLSNNLLNALEND